MQKNSKCKKIVIFSSSVTPQCTPWSDIDIYFEIASEMQKLPVVNDTEAIWDKWGTFSVDDELLSTIMRTGVVVYER